MKQKTIKGFKFIKEDMHSKNGDHKWEVGEWCSCPKEGIKLCEHGFHACKKPYEALEFIYGDKFFLVEARGKIISSTKSDSDKKFVASKMRLVKELPLKEISVKYACASARLCLKNYEKLYPNDKRPHEAIQAAEDYMGKKITLDELNKKLSAACDAAESAARSAAKSAESAAWSAESAARSAESAARSAAWSALHKIFDKIVEEYL